MGYMTKGGDPKVEEVRVGSTSTSITMGAAGAAGAESSSWVQLSLGPRDDMGPPVRDQCAAQRCGPATPACMPVF